MSGQGFNTVGHGVPATARLKRGAIEHPVVDVARGTIRAPRTTREVFAGTGRLAEPAAVVEGWGAFVDVVAAPDTTTDPRVARLACAALVLEEITRDSHEVGTVG